MILIFWSCTHFRAQLHSGLSLLLEFVRSGARLQVDPWRSLWRSHRRWLQPLPPPLRVLAVRTSRGALSGRSLQVLRRIRWVDQFQSGFVISSLCFHFEFMLGLTRNPKSLKKNLFIASISFAFLFVTRSVAANGYCRSEAVSIVFLQKAKDARRVYATVVHAKTNCDGYKEQGITFPSGPLQQRLLEEFYEECQIQPSSLAWVEAHGTGTRVSRALHRQIFFL